MSNDGYLPPGCTHSDVDRAAGVLAWCEECEREVYVDDDGNCRECGAELEG